MSRTNLLLLAILLIATATTAVAQTKSSGSAPMVATAESLPSLDSSSPSQSFQLTPSPQDNGAILPSDDVCYKIRAYIFKRDDDHAPEFVRSTTCGPRRPHTKNVGGPKAKLVPAN